VDDSKIMETASVGDRLPIGTCGNSESQMISYKRTLFPQVFFCLLLGVGEVQTVDVP